MQLPKSSIIPAALLSYHVCSGFVLNPSILSSYCAESVGKCPPSLRSDDRREQMSSNISLFATSKAAESDSSEGTPDLDMMEKQILAKTQADLDAKRVKDAMLGLIQDDSSEEKSTEVTVQAEIEMDDIDLDKPPPSTMSVALAAGSAVALTSLAALHAPIVSLGAFAATTYVAQRDPIKDEDLVEGDLTGPLSRILGRATLDSIEKTKPAVQTVVKASVIQSELEELTVKYNELKKEHELLKSQLEIREAIDEYAKDFTMAQLKDIARGDDIKVSGTKAELMMRLVEAGSMTFENGTWNIS